MHDMKFKGKKKANKYNNGAIRDNNEGKGSYELISPYANKRTAIVMQKGAAQKGERNWENGIPFSRLIQSIERHTQQIKMGCTDEDHAAHCRANIDMLMHEQEMIKMGILPKELDNLPHYEQKRENNNKKKY